MSVNLVYICKFAEYFGIFHHSVAITNLSEKMMIYEGILYVVIQSLYLMMTFIQADRPSGDRDVTSLEVGEVGPVHVQDHCPVHHHHTPLHSHGKCLI